MGSGRLIVTTVLSVLAVLAIAIAAGGAGTRTYAVQLTIAADGDRVEGEVVTDAPSEFCDSSKIRLRESAPGKDDVVARVKPSAGKWHLSVPPNLSGKLVYAEVSKYQLPDRPVVCLAARSPKITAP